MSDILEGTQTALSLATVPGAIRYFTTIGSVDDYKRVAELLQAAKALRAEVAAGYDEHIARAFQAHRALVKEKRDREAEIVGAEEYAKALLVEWDTKVQAAAEAERKVQAEIAADTDRVLLEQVAAAEQALDFAEVERLQIERATIAPVAVVADVPKVDGLHYRITWRAEVLDFAALVQAVAANRALLGLLKVNQSALDQQARSLRQRLALPGVKAVSSKDVVSRR